MAPSSLRKLTLVQNDRKRKIEATRERLASKPTASITEGIVLARIDLINGILSQAQKTHEEIIARDDAAADNYIIENQFDQLMIAFEDALDYFLSLKQRFAVTTENAGNVPDGNTAISEIAGDRALLPKIPLPEFRGKYEEWESFRDLFTSLVHNAPRISDATKLHYLKSCLKGRAANLLDGVGSSNAEYASAWKALKNRFRNPRILVYRHLSALFSLPQMQKECERELRSFLDETQRIVHALQNLSMPVNIWDAWFVFIMSERLAPETRKDWELELSQSDRKRFAELEVEQTPNEELLFIPKFSALVEFLETRAESLSMVPAERRGGKRSAPPSKPGQPPRKVLHAQVSQQSKCSSCSGRHPLSKCAQFKQKSVVERKSEIRRLRLCFNCFGQHMVNACSSSGRCATCQGKHHTLLHIQKQSTENPPQVTNAPTVPPVVSMHAAVPFRSRNILLATARVRLVGPKGNSTCVRAFLDQGSEASVISESVAQLLGLRRRRTRVPLVGLGANPVGTATSMSRVSIRSLVKAGFQAEVDVLILPQLTSVLPSCDLGSIVDRKYFADLDLADPEFWKAQKVDLVIGADLFGNLLRPGVKKLSPLDLVAQDTALGWIVSGPIASGPRWRAGSSVENHPVVASHCVMDQELDQSLQRFWNLEEVSESSHGFKPEDERCERLFRETHRRDPQGRYEVNLPLRSEVPALFSETRRLALGSLSHMYRRFSRDTSLAKDYREFMEAYEKLGHMSRIPPSELQRDHAWYVPHHAVVSENALRRKIRVVFDASRRTRDGHFLNNFLLTGPPLQSDLSLILLNWGRYRFAFTADIVKMFRQILVASEHRDFQRIVWAPTAESEPIDYRLNTVTYGTACAPYLAIRTLLQLAEDEGGRFPLGAQCLKLETYVDDSFGGANDLPSAIRKRDDLIHILATAGIELDKWAANHTDLLPPGAQHVLEKQIDDDQSIKTLGVHWSPRRDEFEFQPGELESLVAANTKRAILSSIARLFDPLGWLAPVTVSAKILMQDMWIFKCDWDTPLPDQIRERWASYCNSLAALPSLSIKRWLGTSSKESCELHGFSDASSRAYAAVVYLRIDHGNGQYQVSLLTAKSKVAPVKTVSIPNLELCGAALLVKLILHVRKLEFLKNLPIFAWSDSQIVLTWLRKHPCHWKTFVANRVSLIQTELPSARWGHVSTKDNPADLATRGAAPGELAVCSLWWKGPSWLVKPTTEWPQLADPVRILVSRQAESDILGRFSSLSVLLRFVAYCKRPLDRMRSKRKLQPPFLRAPISVEELRAARIHVLRLAQSTSFSMEIGLLSSGKALPKRHYLLKLNPFVDKRDGLLRVGGRLADANLSLERKHPPILPYRSELSVLFVRFAHRQCLHGGPTLTSSFVMSQVWILGRARLVKTLIRRCLVCQRIKPHSAHQLMGNFPAARVTRGRAFSTSGLDYAGPFQIRMSKGRGTKSCKAYVVVFICFATRAIHLELSSDLTTATFLSAYRRMAGRRGVCQTLYSDNATNFHGADKELQQMFSQASDFYKTVASLLAKDGTTWSFIPANSPHYGGLWEAGVKSVKHHLKRVVGEHTLTFEEFSTVLVQIEACLNSRPLSALSSDPDDLQALTPAHFLNEGVSSLIPEADFPDLPENRLSRFQLLQRIRNNFWKRWSSEYVSGLQEREKWRNVCDSFAVGQLVLIKDDRYPPAKWPLGRVLEVHPGPDGLVRVVTVRTATHTLKRHIARLCPLALDNT